LQASQILLAEALTAWSDWQLSSSAAALPVLKNQGDLDYGVQQGNDRHKTKQ
jgi:hypothetical protein